MKTVNMDQLSEIIAEVLITEEDIKRRIAELGEEISRDYAGKELLLVCVLKGGMMFMADLARAIKVPLAMDFMAVSSYGADTHSSGVVKIIKDLDQSIKGKHVLIVEDIIDTGLTLNYLVENLRSRNPASLKLCTLLDKPHRRAVKVDIDYRGFEIPDKFVVGYGLDFIEFYRNVPFVFAVKPELYS